MDFPTGRDPACQRLTPDYPTHTISDIFVLMGDIGGRGQWPEREGRGKRPLGPEGGGEERRGGGSLERGMEQGE